MTPGRQEWGLPSPGYHAGSRWEEVRICWSRATGYGSLCLGILMIVVTAARHSTDPGLDPVTVECEPVVLGVILPAALHDRLAEASAAGFPGDHAGFRGEVERIGLGRHGIIVRSTGPAVESSLDGARCRFIALSDPDALAVVQQVAQVMKLGRYGSQRVPPKLVPAADEELREEVWEQRRREGRVGYYIELLRRGSEDRAGATRAGRTD
jgi:hypothetical protein